MAWNATLSLDYTLQAGKTVAHFRHDGPLRILQSLYPEGDAVCHNVLVHPPGGLVGGDTLAIAVTAAPGSHGLITTPGATRFYESLGAPALQHTSNRLETRAPSPVSGGFRPGSRCSKVLPWAATRRGRRLPGAGACAAGRIRPSTGKSAWRRVW